MVVPIFFCSVNRRKVFDFVELLHDTVVFPDFSLGAPDRITVTVQTENKRKTVALSSLEQTAK
jgi:hypothetical protein